MKYSQEMLRSMSEKISLLEYASKTVEFVKRTGKIHYCVCPWHVERTASLAVYEDENCFYCYGCGRHGNIYNWIMLTEHKTFDQAVKKVAELTGSDLIDCKESECVSFYKQLNRLLNPKQNKNTNRTYLDYQKDYEDRFVKEYPNEWLAEGITKESMDKYDVRVDQQSRRIVYPVVDNFGRLIGVKGRTRFANFKELRIPKYINYSSIGQVDYLAGMEQALPYIKEKNEVVIFEGIKSVMKADGWGVHNCVSAETSVLNDEQIKILIGLGIKDVVIAFDSDVKLDKIRDNVRLLKRFVNIYATYDTHKLLGQKESPVDQGKEVWEELYRDRKRL